MVRAQVLEPIELGVRKAFMAHKIASHTHSGYGDMRYIYSSDLEGGPGRNITTDFIFAINAQDNTLSKTLLYRSEDYVYLRSFENEDGFAVYYLLENKKEKTYTLYVNKFSKSEASPQWNPTALDSFPFNKKAKLQTCQSISPDKSKGMLCFFQIEADSILDSRVFVVDNVGSSLWNKEIDIHQDKSDFALLDMVVDNEGDVFAAVYSYNAHEVTREKVTIVEHSNGSLHIYHFTEQDTQIQNEDLDFQISNGKMLVGNSGAVYIGGFTKLGSKNENGSYMVKYDVTTATIQDVDQEEFPDDYEERNVPQNAGYKPNQNYAVVIKGMYEFSNGILGLLGEQRAREVISTGRSYFNHDFVRNVVYARADASGQIKDIEFFDRRAMGNDFKWITFWPFFQDNTLYVLYPDDKNNFRGSEGVPFVYYNYCYAMLTISEPQGLLPESTSMFYDEDYSKNEVARPLFAEPDGFIVIDVDEQNRSNISKLIMQ